MTSHALLQTPLLLVGKTSSLTASFSSLNVVLFGYFLFLPCSAAGELRP